MKIIRAIGKYLWFAQVYKGTVTTFID